MISTILTNKNDSFLYSIPLADKTNLRYNKKLKPKTTNLKLGVIETNI